MKNQNELTISEAQKLISELKASILKLDELNNKSLTNIKELENLNQKLENYSSILSKFEPKDEKEMVQNYSIYLSFLAQKIEDLGKNEDLKKIQKIINISDKIVSLSVLKVALIVAVVTTALNFLILK
ncbi:hypothetical protein [Aliarcobacter trophiarum]|uniref:hypothetical protein n=1 Tax=Aliarcobacter trophiarum TaxID=708186 RepID=UPI00100AD4F1|nr:hypothetical protein [Aliarcobacter trophiarum]RXI27855.1 hypothetical protein CRU89_03420 [Aliarcobacter trophiarum]